MYSSSGEGDKLSSLTSEHPFRHFSLAEIQSATQDFNDELVIGQGGFGKVYKGHINSGESDHVVAIKRLDSMSHQGAPEFKAEIKMLSKLRHCHLVSLIGFCDDNKEMILVYEYMPHGTLYHHLHKAKTRLNWMQRMKIAIGAGRGLEYLHSGVGTHHGIIHRDVKSSNILLDEKWEAMISDFGLSKIGPTNQSLTYIDASVKGTFGYMDPEYYYTRKLTRKTDVYAFGVVLFELLSGRLAVDERKGDEECSLVRWAQKCVKEGKLDQIVDSNIRETIAPKCLRRFTKMADRCLLSVPKERPTMTEVVASLEALLQQQEKYDNSAKSAVKMGFNLDLKYFRFLAKRNYDDNGTSKSKGANEIHQETPDNGTSKSKGANEIHQQTPDNGTSKSKGANEIHQETPVINNLKVFTYDELKCAARGFGYQTFLGEWNYGMEYKGWVDEKTYTPSELDNGLTVTIHRFKSPYSRLDLTVNRLSHPNLVNLIGYCEENEECFIVHEFMHNGNLEDCLLSGVLTRLPLVTRLKMALGIARGLVFLNKTDDEAVSNLSWILRKCAFERCSILLDKDFTAKLLDYNISYFNSPYMDIELDWYYHPSYRRYYVPLQNLSYLAGFSLVLMEILTMKPNFDSSYNSEGKDQKSLGLAKICLELCNDVDSLEKMQTVLNKLYPNITK